LRVLAASFRDGKVARRVLKELQRAYELRAEDAAVAPMGTAAESDAPLTVLAGRFHDDRVGRIRDLVERYGGRVLVEVDERATRRRQPAGSRTNSLAG